MDLVVVDTSVFIDFLRGSRDDLLEILIVNNQVILSSIVYLELLSGVSRAQEKILSDLLLGLKVLDAFPNYKKCHSLLLKAKGSGLLGGLPDLIILAEVVTNKAVLYSKDKKLCALAKKVGIKVLVV